MTYLRANLRRDILYPSLEWTTTANWRARVTLWADALGPAFLPQSPVTVPDANQAVVYIAAPSTVTADKFDGLARQWSLLPGGVTVVSITATTDPARDLAANPPADPCGDDPLCKARKGLQSLTGPLSLVLVLALGVTALYVLGPFVRGKR